MGNSFDYPDIKIESAWNSIILLGNNTSCYKFALGKTILEMNTSTSEVDLRDIALPYAKIFVNIFKSKINRQQTHQATF